jgi:uncharacterized protein with von Willebrand factor type A (vWA) domain
VVTGKAASAAGGPDPGGRLADNITYFARALRAAGLPVGPGAVVDALEAVEAVRIGGRDDLYWTLHAVFVKKHEHSLLFDQAFRLFFRRRALVEKMIALMSPFTPDLAKKDRKPDAGALRIADAMFRESEKEAPREREFEISARMTVSDREILQARDFAQMSADEVAEARRLISDLVLPDDALRTRRLKAAARGRRIDFRRTFRRSLAGGGAMIDLAFRERAERHPPVVALVDISGSMDDYTRIFLHFLHALMEKRRNVHVFLYATRLTNVTRQLRAKDPDEALAACAAHVEDWAGGTRISETLHLFNRDWSRRVLSQGAIALLFTDGLERQVSAALPFELDRLRRSCRRLVWLNPLLRFDGFEARASGIRAMLPHVDEFRPIHNVASMAALCEALSAERSRAADPARWLRQVA